MQAFHRISFLFALLWSGNQMDAAETTIVLTERMHHLRIAGEREWTSFAEQPEANGLTLKFQAKANADERTLVLTQEDVKQRWTVQLNGTPLGSLPIDENPMRVYFVVSPGAIQDGENIVTIMQQTKRATDDVRGGRVAILSDKKEHELAKAKIRIEVRDRDSNERIPSRITIVNENGAMQTVGAESNATLAVRPGIVYTSNGYAEFGVPEGTYTITAGRGFEYSIDSAILEVAAGDDKEVGLSIQRQVQTNGYVACDTHVHTLTHSGHGDATVQERMVTLAAEGIELPIATDHNKHVDHRPFAEEANVTQYFTPVIGNEVTTPTGHFNIFPVKAGARIPNHRSENWQKTAREIFATPSTKVAILNHGRDVHSGVTPLGPKLFNSASGSFQDGWVLRANAMEVVNSSATQTDPMQLFHDWMTLLNRGHRITPVGSSDSHDVGRHFVGQGRTYIRCADREPGKIDIDEAVDRFLQGSVNVSYGLFVEMKINSLYGSGEISPCVEKQLDVQLRVSAPHWIRASRVQLFANGIEVKSVPLDLNEKGGTDIEWKATWKIDRPKHDVHLVAIATGPGIEGLHWKTAKPYQPKSTDWTPKVIGCSGAVWLDVDGDSNASPARRYATQLVAEAAGDLTRVFKSLSAYDQAVAIQVAELIYQQPDKFKQDQVTRELQSASAQTRDGFSRFLRARRDSQLLNRVE